MDTNETTVDSVMREEVSRNLLRYACGQAIFCYGCKRSLDARSSVCFDAPADGVRHTFVVCVSCWERITPEKRATFWDVFYGPTLWPTLPPEPRRPPVRNVARQADLSVGDRVEVRVSGRDSVVRIVSTQSRTSYGYSRQTRRLYFVGVSERTGREVRFTAAKVRRIVSRKVEESC